ncbi:bifunctional phosphopantothenoylcysteine decarboxylase/phosphopantothenate--cysteine ligase CoaBC [Anaeroselena agilis]|uniref:Coenzyme A biosynthesis bifunctional protein CoaBC n=1 Tax=Anaeroselena agilis TaxID=3063788 RepID=A0ABU3NXG9_9FIRM|nr:bifunctional phosphopantothenoylcysteine decarboxylase/phosphopantothenate--cysteine ligase CoaBC [Selenomonadales bacterium 4137-cl]
MLAGKCVVLGVSGGIAAYKAVEVASRLRKQGASVYVVMTRAATKFVTPLTFREISGNPVVTSMWDEPKNWNVEHVALATRADLFLVAPATANVIGKLAAGIADDMLTTTLLATKAPVVLAPAMNCNMYLNPLVQANIAKLTGLGYHFIPPDEGLLACGVEGPGRLPEPAAIVDKVAALLGAGGGMAGRKVLVTAGPTREAIDPVRYISNHSSGKMGYAIARTAAARGADVVLVTGPTELAPPPGVRVARVETAAEMMAAVLAEFDDCDVVVKAAAVADYRVQAPAGQKIKKRDDELALTLVKNPDILAELGRRKQGQLLVGFAAETEELVGHARDKLTRKNLDMIVANDVTLPGAGFGADTNIVKLLYPDGRVEEYGRTAKDELAGIILDKICVLLTNRH